MRPCSIEVEARLGKPIDVAGGVDVRHAGLEGRLVDREAAAVVGGEAAGLEVQAVDRAHPAGREQHHVGAQLAAVVERDQAASGPATLDAVDLGAEAQTARRGRAGRG